MQDRQHRIQSSFLRGLTVAFTAVAIGLAVMACGEQQDPAQSTASTETKHQPSPLEKEARLYPAEDLMDFATPALQKGDEAAADQWLGLLMAKVMPEEERTDRFRRVIEDAMDPFHDENGNPNRIGHKFTPALMKHVRDQYKETFNHCADYFLIYAGSIPGVEYETFLLENVTTISDEKKSLALVYAASAKHNDKADLLAQKGIALPIALQAKHLETAQQMQWVQAHKFPVFGTAEGETPFDVAKAAITGLTPDKLDWYLIHGVGQTDKDRLLAFALQNKNHDAVMVLQKRGAQAEKSGPKPS